MTATPAQVAHYASLAAQAEQHVAGLGLDALIDAGRALRQEQIKARRQQLERIAGEREQADADARDRAERRFEEARDGL